MGTARRRAGGSVLRALGRALAWVVLLAGGAALLLVVVVPRLGGATPYGVATGSMRPAFDVGTLVVVRPVDVTEITTGQVVTYQLRSGDPTVVTHRVVGLGSTADGERTLVTRGDANEVADPRPVRAVQVRGVLWYAVPQLGRVMGLGTPDQRRLLTTGAAVVLLGYAAWLVAGEVRDRRAARPAGPGREGPSAGTTGDETPPSAGLATWWPDDRTPAAGAAPPDAARGAGP
ncbi:signal peptidase I [Isoptericola sp. F-RaC21]|uniref:signal peptidase I n=1 Tax=Isoptericola sp. F-RaC21 TaxID=3141452 RepID=UPI00315BCD54